MKKDGHYHRQPLASTRGGNAHFNTSAFGGNRRYHGIYIPVGGLDCHRRLARAPSSSSLSPTTTRTCLLLTSQTLTLSHPNPLSPSNTSDLNRIQNQPPTARSATRRREYSAHTFFRDRDPICDLHNVRYSDLIYANFM